MKLIELIEKHERQWGTEHYADRPKLAEVLAAPVVAFWLLANTKEKREILTVHPDLRDVELTIAKLVLRSSIDLPAKRLVAVFIGGELLKIRGFKVVWSYEDGRPYDG
ncbi:MAG: hypothetical protein MUF87_14685 [Anaerolineae bacterium]|jgi:hypothetical protein|nr:hypothetical protein [Anaerolineae bacterium]